MSNTLNANTNEKIWVKGAPSAYQKHDITHFPDWNNVIVWDLFFNNLTSGFMFITTLTWFVRPDIFGGVAPYALTLAFFIVLFDLMLLVIDLGDHIRFIHAMRVMHPTAPLSVGVVGLIFYSIMLFVALAIYWGGNLWTYLWGMTAEATGVLDILVNLFLLFAFISACVVICYKGVAFSCTAQPGVRKARWMTPWVVTDALTIGMALLIGLSFLMGQMAPIEALVIPFIMLIALRGFTYALVWMNIHERASLMYSKGHNLMNGVIVYGIAGACSIALCLFGPIGMLIAAGIYFFAGFWERYWIIYVTHPH